MYDVALFFHVAKLVHKTACFRGLAIANIVQDPLLDCILKDRSIRKITFTFSQKPKFLMKYSTKIQTRNHQFTSLIRLLQFSFHKALFINFLLKFNPLPPPAPYFCWNICAVMTVEKNIFTKMTATDRSL